MEKLGSYLENCKIENARLSSFYHDSSFSLYENGTIIFAVQEERLSRIKNVDSFPKQAILQILKVTGINLRELDAVVNYVEPFF